MPVGPTRRTTTSAPQSATLDIGTLTDGGDAQDTDELVAERGGSQVRVSVDDLGIPEIRTSVGQIQTGLVTAQTAANNAASAVAGKQDATREDVDSLQFHFRDPATGEYGLSAISSATAASFLSVNMPSNFTAVRDAGLTEYQVQVAVTCQPANNAAATLDVRLRTSGGASDLADFDPAIFHMDSGDTKSTKTMLFASGVLPDSFQVQLDATLGTVRLWKIEGIVYRKGQSFPSLIDTPADYTGATAGHMVVVGSDGESLDFEPQSAGLGGGTTAVTTDSYGWSLHDDHDNQRGGWLREVGGIPFLYLPDSPATGDQRVFVYSTSGTLRQRITLPDVVRVVDIWSDGTTLWAGDADNNVRGFDLPDLPTTALIQDVAANRDSDKDFYVGGSYPLQGLAGLDGSGRITTVNRRGTTLGRAIRYDATTLAQSGSYNLLNAPYPRDAAIFGNELFFLVPSNSVVRRVNLSLLTDQTDEVTIADEDGVNLTPTGMARDADTWWIVTSDKTVNGYDTATGEYLVPGVLRRATETAYGSVLIAPEDEFARTAMDSDTQVVSSQGLRWFTEQWQATTAEEGLGRIATPSDSVAIGEQGAWMTPYTLNLYMQQLITPTLAGLRNAVTISGEPPGPVEQVRLVSAWGSNLTLSAWAYDPGTVRLVMAEEDSIMDLDPITMLRTANYGDPGAVLKGLAYDDAGVLYGVTDTFRLVTVSTGDGGSPSVSYVSSDTSDLVLPTAEYVSSWGDDWCLGFFFYNGIPYVATPNNMYSIVKSTGIGGRIADQPSNSWGTTIALRSVFPYGSSLWGLIDTTSNVTLIKLDSAGAVRNQSQIVASTGNTAGLSLDWGTGFGVVQSTQIAKGSTQVIAGRVFMVRASDQTVYRFGPP